MKCARKRWLRPLCLLLFTFVVKLLSARAADDDPIGFGDIRLGAPVRGLPIPCLESPVCEGSYNSVWVRVHHANGQVERIDVVYSGWRMGSGDQVRLSRITLPQAIRAHSIRYGGWAPNLGLAGTRTGTRIIVDVANGIAYFADGALVQSSVREVRYLPMSDPLMAAANASPLSNHGDWLIKAARSTPRYKDLPAASRHGDDGGASGQEKIAARFEKMSSQLRSYAQATLMLSAHVSESLKNHQEPDPAVAEKLRKAFALLTAKEDEANSLIKDQGGEVRLENGQHWPLDIAGEAESKMKELVSEGFVE